MPSSRHHTEWLSLIEVSGPFLFGAGAGVPADTEKGTSLILTGWGSGVETGRVAPGDCSPRAPADPYVPFQAYGSSYHEHATGRHTE